MGVPLLIVTAAVYSIGNQWLSVEVTDAICQVRPGSILCLNDFYSGQEITGEGQFSGINSGSYIPANGEITVNSDTSLVFHTAYLTDGSSNLPIDITVEYRVVRRGLEISYRFWYTENCEVWSPIDVDFSLEMWDSISISNQSAIDEEFQLTGSLGYQRFSGDQLFRLSGNSPDALFLFPNISKAFVVIDDYQPHGYLSLRVLDTEEPRENAVGPLLHSIIPAGQIDEYFIRLSLDEYFAPVFISAHPQGAERSSAWILDELTFVHPEQGYIWGYSETSDGDEAVSAGLISLLEAHPTMKMNWLLLPDAILTPNRDSVWFEPGHEDSWSHWHCTWRFCTEATPEYLQWLRNIQNNAYPWAERVQMGSHGYHHTPNPDSSYGGFHEFITYEPDEHQERFRVFFQDLNACCLDTSLLRVIRYPGHRTSLSGLQATIDHGFTFFCNGWRLIDWYAGKQFRNQWISRFQTVNGRIWGSNSVWWGDYQMMYPYEYLSEVMEKGKFGLLGCHPISMLSAESGVMNPDAYARIDSVLTSLESDYPHFLWLFPGEYGDFLEDCFNISVNSIRGGAPCLSMEFTGAVPEGLTLCAFLHPDDEVVSVAFDGVSVPWELREEEKLFSILPESPWDEHVFEVLIDPMGVESGSLLSNLAVTTPSPSAGRFIGISVSGLEIGSSLEILVHDIAGRLTFMAHSVYTSGEVGIQLAEPLSPGVYFITVKSSGLSGQTRTVIIR